MNITQPKITIGAKGSIKYARGGQRVNCYVFLNNRGYIVIFYK